MNILSATNALKEIKLSELDDEFQIAIMNVLNQALPDGVSISGELNGADIRKVVDTEIPNSSRRDLMQSTIFAHPNDIVRFYNNVERLQEAHIQAIIYDDAIKGNFITNMAVLAIILVVSLMGIYVYTNDTRGKVPDSKVAHIAIKIVDNRTHTPIQTTDTEETK